MMKQTSHWWWFDNHDDTTSKRSPWLQSTLAELQRKTEGMLILIEGDAADSFAQRAEMFYKNRPELISMVEEFYRAHRSLAERYDHVKCDSATRLVTRLGSPFSSTKYHSEKSICGMSDLTYDSYSVSCDLEDCAESEVDDPEEVDDQQGDGNPVQEKPKEEEFPDEVRKMKEEMKRLEEENRAQKDQLKEKDEERIAVRMLKEELMRLGEENRAQKEQLKQKDEEKIAVIRQLSMAVDMLKEENVELRKCLAKESPKRSNPFDFNKLKGATIFGNLFNGSQKHHDTIVAL